jgi:hypothetical protein
MGLLPKLQNQLTEMADERTTSTVFR